MRGSINYKLKASIVERGYTQAEVASAIKMTQGTLSRKIKGLRPFEEEEMQKISDFLQKDVLDIFF